MLRLNKTLHGVAGAAAVAVGVLLPMPGASAVDPLVGDPEAGKKIATNRNLGNCIACHHLPDGESPGTIGPSLVAMKSRYPDKAKLRAQIWDATASNPGSSMPPFGKHAILTEQQINDLLEYLWSI